MPQYQLQPRREYPRLKVFVGWDPTLATFFGRVVNPTLPEEEQTILWVGTTYEEITDIDILRAKIGEYAPIDYDTDVKLRTDSD